MALNWAMLTPDRRPEPLPHETTIMAIEAGVELSLTIPNEPPARGATAGGSGGSKVLKGYGRLDLTDQRLIFVTPSQQPDLNSLSVPLASILSTAFQQPMFGSNYLLLDIKPSRDGGLTNGTKAEIRLKDRPLFAFVSTLDKTRERAIYMKRQAQSEEETLPLYENVEDGPSASGSAPPAPPPAPGELPPGYDA